MPLVGEKYRREPMGSSAAKGCYLAVQNGNLRYLSSSPIA